MVKVVEYKPQNVCSRLMRISVDDGKVVSLEVVGGCQGNLRGISKLVANRSIEEVISLLEGIQCRESMTGTTSCPDQLAQALKSMR